MEGVHSYEQRSASSLNINYELDLKHSRVIIVDRHQPDVSWSTQNRVICRGVDDDGGLIANYFSFLKLSLFNWFSCSNKQSSTLASKKTSSKILASIKANDGADHYGISSPSVLSEFDSGPFPSNEWLTSKYTFINFLPKNLFEQFRRFANFYFLTTSILQIIIPFSPVGPVTSLLPLIFVVSATSIKQAYEDYLRHKLDKEVNNRWCHVLRDKKLIRTRSKDIRVGDFVHVRNNEEIPCDMLLLSVSNQADSCYVTTANLDGETNLKSRTCFNIKDQLGTIEKLDDSLLVIECERPNATLYEFNGYLRVPKSQYSYSLLMKSIKENASDDSNLTRNNSGSIIRTILIRMKQTRLNLSLERLKGTAAAAAKSITSTPTTTSKTISKALTLNIQQQKQSQNNEAIQVDPASPISSAEYHEISLDISNLLLRASRLRNTSYIYGLAIYTGKDTKLAHNSQVKPNKFSSTERKVNIFLFIAFAILTMFSFVGALMYSAPNYWFFKGLNKSDSFGQILVAHFLIYNYLVPISLYVTLEFVKFFGTIAVLDDKKMKVAVWHTITNSSSNDSTSKQQHHSEDHSDQIEFSKQASQNGSNQITSATTITCKFGQLEQVVSTLSSAKRIRIVEGPKCNSSDLNEELGQVEVLFSDKTGTLTENKMRFMACSVYSQMYRSIAGQLYLQPASLYRANIPQVVERLAKVSTNRQALLVPNLHHCEQRQKALISGQKRKKQEQFRPFDHRSIPALSSLKLIDNMNQEERLVEFFICLCLCSTITLNETLPLAECLPDRTMNEYDFQSASPDEESLISAAHLYGVTMCKSNDRECFIVIEGKKSTLTTTTAANNVASQRQQANTNFGVSVSEDGKFKALVKTQHSNDKYIVRHFERLIVFEFNSIRKRMSVIYKDCDNDCILMVSKGSEEVLDCVKLNNIDQESIKCVNITLAHFEAFAKSGLRTLLVARRVLTKEEFEIIFSGLKEARLSIRNRDHLLNSLYQRAEQNLKLIGTTAVEDTLQESVPETIANLKEAGIKVWLLTGDKVETAISVAYLCKLLEREMVLFHLVRQQDVRACRKLLASFEKKIKSLSQHTRKHSSESNNQTNAGASTSNTSCDAGFWSKLFYSNRLPILSDSDSSGSAGFKQHKFALIADGRSLHYAMKYAKDELAQLCEQCTCVLGCRLSPLQKAEVVDMIKKSKEKPITAAIGDGANDVSMIQEAHVGIGVSGKEGRQAVNCSDFSINRFYMLNRLLFVHGHLFYHRTANTIHYFFYKNLLFILPQFLYSFYNFSSAKSLYHPILLIGYNLFFTSLPILIYGLFEVHIPESILENYPKLYRVNRGNSQLKLSIFFAWLSIGAIQAIVGFYFLYYNWGSHTPFLESGKMAGINGFSVILYIVTVVTATFKLFFLSKSHTISFILSAFLSLLMLPVIFYTYSMVDWGVLLSDNTLYGQFGIYIHSPMFWIAIGITTTATLLPNIILFLKERIVYFKKLNVVMGRVRNVPD